MGTPRNDPFSSVMGHEVARKELRHLLSEGGDGRFLLLQGPRGVGKGTIARLFARALLCDRRKDEEICGACPACMGKNHPDLLITEPPGEGERVGIEVIREIQALLPFPPFRGKYRVWILDPVESLTLQAQEALLRTLEEPPPSLWILGISHAPERLPLTLRSRSLKVPFLPLDPATLKILSSDAPQELLELGSLYHLQSFKGNYLSVRRQWDHLLSMEPYDPFEAGKFPRKAEILPGGFGGFLKILLQIHRIAEPNRPPYHEELARWVEEIHLLHSALMDLEANVNPAFVSESLIRELRRLRKRKR